MPVQLSPDSDHRIPFEDAPKPSSFLEELQTMGNTAEVLVEMGAPLEVSNDDASETTRLIDEAIKKKKTSNLTAVNTAYAAATFLRTYGSSLALDVSAARSAITNKLMELANCGDPKFELKALELLGKHSDIGLFTERSELTINYKTPEDLEEAIKTRVKRLLNQNLVDVTPTVKSLEEEFGMGEFASQDDDEEDAGETPE